MSEGLSRERIVGAAIALLDDAGEQGLTFRALASRLGTGAGAIYWHVANKGELLLAAADEVVARAMGEIPSTASPEDAIRGIALGVFDAVDAHPWLGAQLSRAPWEAAMLQIFERIGREVQALGVLGTAQFTAASAFVSYIVGVSVQNAAHLGRRAPSIERVPFLETAAKRWKTLDPDEYPFIRKTAMQVANRDDHQELLAGIDLILTGIAARAG